MPWSAKAQTLLENQYAPVGSAARAGLGLTIEALADALRWPGTDTAALAPLLDHYRTRNQRAARYVEAYRQYCWPVKDVKDLKLAPFHLLASKGATHTDKDHVWHLRTLARLAEMSDAESSPLTATKSLVVDMTDLASEVAATAWWTDLTAAGGEGMVVKPLDFVTRGPRGLVQPAVKCRGKEYLRIIYGPEYDAPENLDRLRKRGVHAKRSLALREFALGVEALERFVRREPLRRTQNVSSRCWHSKASRSIRGCDGAGASGRPVA